jgi:hypothetical protein
MDKARHAGFLSPFGNNNLKIQLLYLTWNVRTKNLWTDRLNSGDNNSEFIGRATKNIADADAMVTQQTDAIMRIVA